MTAGKIRQPNKLPRGARLSCGGNNRTDFCRLGHFEECTGFDIVKIAVDRDGGRHEWIRANAPHIGHDAPMDISGRQPVDELPSVRARPPRRDRASPENQSLLAPSSSTACRE